MISASFIKQLALLDRHSQLFFGACLTQRMMPNFQLFAESTGFASGQGIQKYLELVWEYLGQPKARINFAIQQENFQSYIPDERDFDIFGVYPAIDCCVSIEVLFNGILSADGDEAAQVSQISMGSVIYFLEMQFADTLSEAQLVQQPLVQDELAFQEYCYQLACEYKQNPVFIKEVRPIVWNQNISNLGISLQDD
ncbi:YjaG family protein [Celerinatantimonas sp. YJH-8]|uniref:YjaG family protein n=1 Tax=Celerinatantimonas sp. YJH-8 TaxID=3228714 RepID=UPI0038CABD94